MGAAFLPELSVCRSISMIRELEITTGSYEKPLRTSGIYEDAPGSLIIKWKQIHDGDKEHSFYEIRLDKDTGVAVVKRSGEYTSRLVFDTSKKTEGVVHTPYGDITTDIKTEYINLPSVLCPKFEISYEMGADNIKNLFSVKLL